MTPSRFDGTGELAITSVGWRARRLNRPNNLWSSNGVSFGPDGRLYVAEFLGGRISAVDPASGDVETVVDLDGPVQGPDDLAFGVDGSMYIADLTPGRIWRRTVAGEFSLVTDQVTAPNGITCVGNRLFVNEMRLGGRLLELFPDGGEPAVLTEGLAMGNAMQLGPDGCLYYPHMLSGQVWRILPDGGEPELVASEIDSPVAVRFDRAGTLTVLSRGESGAVISLDLAADRRSVVHTGIAGLDNAAFDAENRMLVSSYASGGITEIHPDGRSRELVPRGMNGPFGIAVDLRGTVFAADHWRVVRVHEAAEPETFAMLHFAHGLTTVDGQFHMTTDVGQVCTYDPVSGETRVRASNLDRPTGIAVSGDALLVAETGTGRVLRIAADDELTVLAEGLEHPVDVAVDDAGNRYVSDDHLGAVLRLDPEGPAVIAGGLGAPQGLIVRDDELFVVDAAGRRLLSISPTGKVRIEAANLAVGLPEGIHRPESSRTAEIPAPARPFAAIAAGPDGTLLLGASGEGTILKLSPA